MLGDTFVKGDGTQVSIDDLKGKYIGVLFSAIWHWQCRRFQQMLEYTYEKLKGEGTWTSSHILFIENIDFTSISDRLCTNFDIFPKFLRADATSFGQYSL